MRYGSCEVTVPAVDGAGGSEAEMFGSAVWLWMHSAAHRDAPLHTLSALLLPALKSRQYALGVEGDKPVFYLSWAKLSEDAERRYLSNPPVCMPEADWTSGERMWIVDWVAPFGHTRLMSRFLAQRLFPGRWARALYHRGDERGLRVLTFRGIAVMPQEARFWFDTHPIAFDRSAQRRSTAAPGVCSSAAS
jgi:cytolysin-activating lysine-acyltransferase